MIVIGLMSGTSVDGIDAAVVRLEGAPPSLIWEVLGHSHRSFTPELRAEIFACFRPETGSVDGIDAAVVRLEGAPPSLIWEVLGHSHRSFTPELRAEIFACFRPETGS